MRDCDIQLINLKSLEFMICIIQFTSTNHVILPFFADLKFIIYIRIVMFTNKYI